MEGIIGDLVQLGLAKLAHVHEGRVEELELTLCNHTST